MTIWRLIPHHLDRDVALQWTRRNGRAAIGWGKIGALGARRFGDQAAIYDAIQHQYRVGNHPVSNYKSGAFSLWNFYAVMKIGDLIILRGNKSSRVVRVAGEYFFDAENTPFPDDFHNHQREVEVTNIDANWLWHRAGRMANDDGSIYRTLIRCEKPLSDADFE